MSQVVALKIAWCLCAFLWAFVSIEKRWGAWFTLVLCVGAVSLGASAARDVARMAAREWDDV